jgi:hypothetical protein
MYPQYSGLKSSAYCLFHAGFLLGLLFNPDDRGEMCFRNINTANYEDFNYEILSILLLLLS